MKKWVKYGFPITCVVVVGGTLIAVGNLKSKADQIHQNKASSSYNISLNNTNTINTIVNNTVENKAENTITNNTVQNTIINTTNTTNTVVNTTVTNTAIPKTEETDKDLDKRDDKEKAIEMVQKEWGEDSSVYFTIDKEKDGIFIVAVRDNSNTAAKAFYKVDLNNNTVELDW